MYIRGAWAGQPSILCIEAVAALQAAAEEQLDIQGPVTAQKSFHPRKHSAAGKILHLRSYKSSRHCSKGSSSGSSVNSARLARVQVLAVDWSSGCASGSADLERRAPYSA